MSLGVGSPGNHAIYGTAADNHLCYSPVEILVPEAHSQTIADESPLR